MPMTAWITALYHEKISWSLFFVTFFKAPLWLYFLFWTNYWDHIQKLISDKASTGVCAWAYSEAPLDTLLHISQQSTFQDLALCYQLSAQSEFLRKRYWERNVQADVQKARVFSWSGFFTLPKRCNADSLFTTGKQNIVLMHENTVVYKAVRSISQMSNVVTSCSKAKRKKLLKQSKETFGMVARHKFCFDTIKYILWWHHCNLCNSDCNLCFYILLGTTQLLFQTELLSAAIKLYSQT